MSADTFWTPDRVDRLRALRRDGRTLSQVAAALGDGCNRSMVAGKLKRLGEFSGNGHGGPGKRRIVDADARAVIARMIAEGATLAEIGAHLGVHKRTAGRIVREIGGGPAVKRPAGARPPRRARVSREVSNARARARRAAAPGVVQDRVLRFFDGTAAGTFSVRLVDAHNHHCRWPFGDGENFRFCGAPADVAAGRPYCDRHDALAHGRAFSDPSRTSLDDGSAMSLRRLAEAAE